MKAAASRRPPNGCSTTTTWSKSRSARSARTCRRSSIASSPSSPPARSPASRACSASRGHSSRTPTAGSSPRHLRRFVCAYQGVEPLTIGELWAVAITLRIVLVENLRRVAQRIVTSRGARQEADAVADRLLGVNGQAVDPDALRAWRTRTTALVPAFAVQLVHRLRDQDPKITPALLWLEKELARHDTSSDAASPGRASAPGRLERHGPQHHHQHAPDVGCRLGGVFRKRQPRR